MFSLTAGETTKAGNFATAENDGNNTALQGAERGEGTEADQSERRRIAMLTGHAPRRPMETFGFLRVLFRGSGRAACRRRRVVDGLGIPIKHKNRITLVPASAAAGD
jgi:hypothetical protein